MLAHDGFLLNGLFKMAVGSAGGGSVLAVIQSSRPTIVSSLSRAVQSTDATDCMLNIIYA